MLWGGNARLFLQVKQYDEKIAKIAIIHVACPQTFFFSVCFCCWMVVCLFAFLFFFFFFFFFFWQFDSMRENECDALEKNTKPLALAVTPRLLFSYARLRMSKIEGNKQANIHAIFAIFLTSFLPLPLPLQATYSSFLWLYFLSWRFYWTRLLYFLTLPSFFFPKFSTLVQAILVFFTLSAGDADHVRYPC